MMLLLKPKPMMPMTWISSIHLKGEPLCSLERLVCPTFPHLLEGLHRNAHLSKTPNWIRCILVKPFQSIWVHQDMGQNLILNFIARSFDYLPQAHMLWPELLMTF